MIKTLRAPPQSANPTTNNKTETSDSHGAKSVISKKKAKNTIRPNTTSHKITAVDHNAINTHVINNKIY